jgi:hypothetical protein
MEADMIPSCVKAMIRRVQLNEIPSQFSSWFATTGHIIPEVENESLDLHDSKIEMMPYLQPPGPT